MPHSRAFFTVLSSRLTRVLMRGKARRTPGTSPISRTRVSRSLPGTSRGYCRGRNRFFFSYSLELSSTSPVS